MVDGTHVLKFYDSAPSLAVVAALGEAGLPVAAPIRSRSGGLSVSVDDGRFAAVFPFVPGRTPDGWPLWDTALLRSLGSILPIDPVRLAFCQLRRYLGDASVRLRRLADPGCPDRSAVEADLVEWGVRPWRALADPH